MKVSVVIIALNEAESIPGLMKEMPVNLFHEIIFVDGNSTDDTRQIIKDLGYPVYIQPTKGFGEAFDYGISKATGDVIILMNSDGSQNPADIPKLLDKINEGYDIVLASRYMKESGSDDDTFVRHIGNRFFTRLTNFRWKTKISDALYFFIAVRKEITEKMEKPKSKNFDYCAQFVINAHKAGAKFGEVPSFERKRTGGKEKTVAWKHGSLILWSIIRG